MIVAAGDLACLEGAEVWFGRRRVLADVRLTIRPGDFWGLIGPNGAGKSTLLGLFNGLTAYRSGRVEYAGRTVSPKSAAWARRSIAHVFQATDMDPKMPLTVFETVLAGTYGRLGLFKKPGKREKDLALRSLEAVGLAGLAGRPVGHLSGGERQRAALARALAQEPDLLLLDEPTASLDWQAQREILRTIDDLRRRFRLSVIMVSHDLNAVFHLAAKVAMLKDGRLIWSGPVEESMDPDRLGFLYSVPISIVEHEGRRLALF
ncbi:MAG: ABC transporter ATP-binding protein [Desulfovibrio sp.]|nr:ABC transporter ATP-binding protein [Desulfovibrio sp.]